MNVMHRCRDDLMHGNVGLCGQPGPAVYVTSLHPRTSLTFLTNVPT